MVSSSRDESSSLVIGTSFFILYFFIIYLLNMIFFSVQCAVITLNMRHPAIGYLVVRNQFQTLQSLLALCERVHAWRDPSFNTMMTSTLASKSTC